MENKFKHNKKRNTAFLYECLVRELTKSMLEKNDSRRNSVLMILKEFFSQETTLYKELKIYKLLQANSVEEKHVEKFINEAKIFHIGLDKNQLFNEQTSLINSINKTLGFSVYENFIPNYKHLATISQIFNTTTPLKEKILLEESLKTTLYKKEETKEEKLLENVDKVVYKTFVEKFNKEYSSKLLKEQKDLLGHYVSSEDNDSIELKVYLNEEIYRLKNGIKKALKIKDVSSDRDMVTRVKKLNEFLETFKENKINEESLGKLLKVQQFVHEVNSND